MTRTPLPARGAAACAPLQGPPGCCALARVPALAALVLLGAAVVGTAAPPEPTAPAPRPSARVLPPDVKFNDGYEVIVYGLHRPIRVRVAVLFEGKPVADRWADALRLAFDYFDRDGDGSLSAAEVPTVFSATGLAAMVQNGTYTPTPADPPTLDRLDKDGDRKVSFAEFAGYHRAAAGQLVRSFPPVAENPASAQATEALFKLFDRNGDGKLTKDEVDGSEKFLATKDGDEDECLSINELVPGVAGDPRAFAAPVPVVGGTRPTGEPPKNVVVFDIGRVPGTVTQRLLGQYDKDKDFELTPEESGFDGPTFARLDADKDGTLSGEELDAWRTGPPDVEVTLSLASKPTDCRADVTTPARDLEARGFTIPKMEPARFVLRHHRQPIELLAFAPVTGPFGRGQLRQQLAGMFPAAAGDKGYVVEKDLLGPNAPRFQLLRVMFDQADRDADGKMTREEFDRFIDLQQSFLDLGMALTPAVQTPTLFQLLDENRDGRLGVRELRTAWTRLLPLEPPGPDGKPAEVVTRAAIQPVVAVRLTRTPERGLPIQPVAFGNPNATPNPQRGPLWFRKMDGNGDGDVSRVEFLGTRAEFDAIDTDRDALISLEEAEAHDRAARKADDKK